MRLHLQAMLASAGIVALLSFLAGAAILMAGPFAQDPPVRAGLLAFVIGGVCAIIGAVGAGWGQLRILAAAKEPTAPALGVVEGVLARTTNVFALLPRLAIAGCVALIAAYLVWAPAGFWGTIVGTFVVIQVALGLLVIQRRVLSPSRLHRRA